MSLYEDINLIKPGDKMNAKSSEGDDVMVVRRHEKDSFYLRVGNGTESYDMPKLDSRSVKKTLEFLEAQE